jgi:hypothetical protein
MSGLSINSLNNYYQPSYTQSSSSSQNEFQSLGLALQSGNLSAAQTAFSALEQAFQNQGQPSTSTSGSAGSSGSSASSNPITADLNSLATALNSGNLSAAQTSYTQLQQDMQAQGGGHHHHHHGGGGGGGEVQSLMSQLSPSSGSSTSGTTLDVQA